MALYAIGDLHLSLGADKPMDVFGGPWENYVEKIRLGFSALHDDDVCVLCGDLAWGMTMEQALPDFQFIEALPGKKILLKGNHDFWWSTAKKAYDFFEAHDMHTMDILNNNCYFYGDYAICGTRGWFYEEAKGKAHDRPIVLMSHQDVVPAEGTWSHAPFSGDIADGKVWGRGASDTKASLMAFFQAVEELLAAGYEPANDVYLSSSCTEEWAGDGAPKLVAELKRRGVRPFLVCDEGGGIITEPIGGIPGNFAMVGVFEKGKADVKFTARSNGGHASAPMANSPIARLSAFVTDVEKHDPFRRKFLPEVSAMFARLAPYAPFGLRLVMGNLWLFQPLMKIVLPRVSAQAGAMLHTTIAFTMQSGADAYNVLPQEATLGANMRFIPHQGEQESLAIIRRLAEKHGLEMEVIHANDYSETVDIHGEAFRQVEQVIGETFPGLPVSPYVMTGATDAQFYQEICDNCLRFAPVIYGPEQMKGMHGIDENIEYNCLPGAVDFYKNLIRAQER